MFTTRTLLAGKGPILIFAVLTAAAMFLRCGICLRFALAGISALLLLFTISFFRDPDRKLPASRERSSAGGWHHRGNQHCS